MLQNASWCARIFSRRSFPTPSAAPGSVTSPEYLAFREQPTACGAEAPAAAKSLSFAAPGDEALSGPVEVVLHTSCGPVRIRLDPAAAPETVNSFVFLARQGYFDGVTFHRVLPGFMAQGGDPTGTGGGGPGYEFVNEDSDLTFDKAGVVAMANAGRNTNGSQFFITFGPQPTLNGNYTIFGQVTSGMDVVNGITLRDPQQNPTFQGDAIQSVTITEK